MQWSAWLSTSFMRHCYTLVEIQIWCQYWKLLLRESKISNLLNFLNFFMFLREYLEFRVHFKIQVSLLKQASLHSHNGVRPYSCPHSANLKSSVEFTFLCNQQMPLLPKKSVSKTIKEIQWPLPYRYARKDLNFCHFIESVRLGT